MGDEKLPTVLVSKPMALDSTPMSPLFHKFDAVTQTTSTKNSKSALPKPYMM